MPGEFCHRILCFCEIFQISNNCLWTGVCKKPALPWTDGSISRTFYSNDELLTGCVLAPLYPNSKSDFVLHRTENFLGCCLSVLLQCKLKLEHQVWLALTLGAWQIVESFQEISFGFNAFLEFWTTCFGQTEMEYREVMATLRVIQVVQGLWRQHKELQRGVIK